jgi:glycosyltransferase involved in cell wall biosynthesis
MVASQQRLGLSNSMTRICYFDAAIRDNAGHHANACRHFTGEFRRRAFAVHAFGSRALNADVGRELQVEPLFRHHPYVRLRGGPYVYYHVARSSYLFDLRSAWRRGPYDVVFFHSIMAAQLAAVALWLRDFRPEEMPFVVIGFDMPSGSKLNDQWNFHTPILRKAARLFDARYLPRTLFFTFDQAITDDYAGLLNVPVQTMPTVHAGLREPRLRRRDPNGLISVAFLGYQRPEKGYHLLPEIVRQVFDRRLPVKFLLHNSAPDDGPVGQELRALAHANPNIAFVEESGDELHWQGLLDRSDLMVLPYEPNRYRQSGSGVATESVSGGIPMVVPPGSTMETLAAGYQGCATSFSDWRADAVADAIERVVTNFEVLARDAEAGAWKWRRDNGVKLFVDRLLQMPGLGNPVRDIKPTMPPLGNVLVGKVLNRLVRHLTY